MNNNSKSIYQTVSQIDLLLKKSKDIYFKELLQRSKGRIIIFDKEGNAYVGIIEKLVVDENNSYYIDKEDKNNFFAVKFFEGNNSLLNADENNPVSVIEYSLLKNPPAGKDNNITLELIYTSQDYTQRGIGTNMLRSLHYIAQSHGLQGLSGVCLPYDYARQKIERITKFYNAANITVSPTKTGYKNQHTKNLLSLVYNKEQEQNTKDCLINYPIDKNNYMVVLEPKNLVYTSYQGRQQE